jgi:hypothetical protein
VVVCGNRSPFLFPWSSTQKLCISAISTRAYCCSRARGQWPSECSFPLLDCGLVDEGASGGRSLTWTCARRDRRAACWRGFHGDLRRGACPGDPHRGGRQRAQVRVWETPVSAGERAPAREGEAGGRGCRRGELDQPAAVRALQLLLHPPRSPGSARRARRGPGSAWDLGR